MDKTHGRSLRVAVCALASLLLMVGVCACAKSDVPDAANASGGDASSNANQPNEGAAAGDDAQSRIRKFDAEIAGLEKQSEKNPGDDDVRLALSQAYRRRADALRDAQQLKQALLDYRNALSHNPDNEEAQQRAAEIARQVEGEATGENGEPAPLPITPNVTTDDDGDETANPSPTKETPKRKP